MQDFFHTGVWMSGSKKLSRGHGANGQSWEAHSYTIGPQKEEEEEKWLNYSQVTASVYQNISTFPLLALKQCFKSTGFGIVFLIK